MRRARDGGVQGLVGGTRRLAVGRIAIGLERIADHGDVLIGPPLGRDAGDQGLDQLAEVEESVEAVPIGEQRAPDHLRGLRPGLGDDERAAAAAPPHLDVTEGGEAVDRLADGRAAHPEHHGHVSLGREALSRHELAERDRGDEPVGDVLGGAPEPDGLEDHGSTSSGSAYQRARNRASVFAPSTMLLSSTASSTPWMLRVRGP